MPREILPGKKKNKTWAILLLSLSWSARRLRSSGAPYVTPPSCYPQRLKFDYTARRLSSFALHARLGLGTLELFRRSHRLSLCRAHRPPLACLITAPRSMISWFYRRKAALFSRGCTIRESAPVCASHVKRGTRDTRVSWLGRVCAVAPVNKSSSRRRALLALRKYIVSPDW